MKASSLLKLGLKGNATFSMLSGVVLIIFNHNIQNLFGIEYSFLSLGVMLVAFAAYLMWIVKKTILDIIAIKAIIAMDILWVIGSVVLLLIPIGISSFGLWSIGIVALIVADFALLQYVGLKRTISKDNV